MGFDLPPEAKTQQEAERKAAEATAKKERIKEEKREAKRVAKKARRKTDPELLAFSRELRDRWQEHVTAEPKLLLERQAGKYDVGRLIEGMNTPGSLPVENVAVQDGVEVKRLEAA